jgi:predicted deacylase
LSTTLNAVRSTIDFDREGKQVGRLLVPDSRNDGAWSYAAVPIACVAHGSGDTAVLLGGTHGDEYEGQVAIRKLAAQLEPSSVHGRLILVPCLSMDASRAGTRLWPSGTNFNRAFLGRPNGAPEEQLADYLTRVLFPLADTVFDLHSGGRSLRFHAMTTMIEVPDDDARRRRMLDAMLAWNLDFHMTYAAAPGSGLLPAEADRQGKVVITTELGGGGQLTKATLGLAERGLRNVLRHLGHLDGEVESRASMGLRETVQLSGTSPDSHVVAPSSGVLELLVDPAEPVVEGQTVARVHPPEHLEREPDPVINQVTGVVAAVRALPSTRQGDVVAAIAEVEPA